MYAASTHGAAAPRAYVRLLRAALGPLLFGALAHGCAVAPAEPRVEDMVLDGGAQMRDGGQRARDGGVGEHDGGKPASDSSTEGQDVDGAPDDHEDDLCPSDATKIEPGECGCGVPEGSCAAKVRLPIEVLGPAGTRETVEVQVDDPQGVTHLYVRCNSCGYSDLALNSDPAKVKATVRINSGEPIAIKHFKTGTRLIGNTSIEVLGAEADYGGIGGAFRTVRFKVPVTGLIAGINTITFEHRDAAPPSIGFRIIELNLLRGGSLSERVLAEEDFLLDDPSTWTPGSDAEDISAGKILWTKRDSLYDPGLDAIDGALDGAGVLNGNMTASCADCHASDGRDLAYFNFTDYSIIERSYFHGLTREQGRQIAAYIRSLKLPLVRSARPWNPPYQPGPGLDSRPVYEWAAGAGVDAILDKDADMAPYLFPQGDSLTAVRAVVDRYATLNLRELPVALPMPEWNQWLPLIHPSDAFKTEAAAIRSDFNGVDVGKPYYEVLYEAARDNPTPQNLGAITNNIKKWLRRDLNCSSNGPGNGEPMRGLNGAVLSAIKLPVPTVITSTNCSTPRTRAQDEPFELAKRALTGWMATKLWELVHRNNLELRSATMTAPVCSSGRCVDASEPRGWVVEGRNVFDRPPHFIAHNSRNFFDQDLVTGLMESNAWYQLNMILNSGYRRSMPNHFAYVYSHVELLQDASDKNQGFRFWTSLIKQRQLQTNGQYGKEVGLDLRTAQPYIYYSSRFGDTAAQSSVGQPLWGRLSQAMLEDFVADANNATAQNWADAVNNSVVQPRNSTDFSVCTSCFESSSRTDPFDLGAWQGRNTYRVIPKLREIGVAPEAITALIDWSKKTWPNGDWDALR